MIIDNTLKIKTNPSNYKHYISKGYQINKCGDEIFINIEDLPEKSHVRVRCKCSKCDNIKDIEYHNYKRQIKDSYYVCLDCWKYKLTDSVYKKYGVSNIREKDGTTDKIKKTNLERYNVEFMLCKKDVRDRVFKIYGVTNISKLDSIKEIKRNKSLEKFGTSTPLQDDEIIKTIRRKHINSGRWKDYDKTKYEDYRKKVNYLTKKVKKQLFEEWNGYDYYDNEYIIENLKLDRNDSDYPSIDHKESVLSGFLSEKSPETISDIINLCITKRRINSNKLSKNYEEFIANYEFDKKV